MKMKLLTETTTTQPTYQFVRDQQRMDWRQLDGSALAPVIVGRMGDEQLALDHKVHLFVRPFQKVHGHFA